MPSKERKNMLNLAHATNHRGPDGMMQQMRGRIFWEGMNNEAKELVRICVRYHTRRQAGREKRRGKIMTEMETRMGRTMEGNRNLAIEMATSPSAPCGRDHLHVPQFHNQNSTENRGTQQDATF